MLDGCDVLHLNRQQRAFRNEKSIGWNIPCNKKVGAQRASVNIKVRPLPAREMFEALGRNLEGEFLADFPYHALKIGFISFAVSPEKSHFPGMHDAGDIVPLLQQEATLGIDNYCSGDLSVPKSIHISWSSLIVWPGQQLRGIELSDRIALQYRQITGPPRSRPFASSQVPAPRNGRPAISEWGLQSKRQKDRFYERIEHVIQQGEFSYLT